jgi:predicted metallo-beta-lactamase superfamily hydrolase
MINAPTAKALLEIKQSANVVIWDYQSYFEITIDSKEIAPQRMTTPPEARKFKTLGAAYSYLRNFLEHKSDILIKRHDPDTGTGDIL